MLESVKSKLALEGGVPVRTKAFSPEWPGALWYDDSEMEAVERVVKARSPFRFYGPDVQHMVDKLEKEFSSRLGVKYALGVSSGTSALYTALGAMGIGPGDEVLLPGYLWTSCINAVVMLGAIPRLVEIDDTFTMCPHDLQKKISPHSKVILLVHMSGASADIEAIMEIARKNNLMVLEDCAQANGACYKGKPVGSFGDIGIFSLQINKNITAGEGGLVACNDDYLYKRCFAAHDLGYARSDKGRLLDTCEDTRLQIWGFGARMNELTGAVALAQLQKLDKITLSMRNAKKKIRQALGEIPGIKLRRLLDAEGDSGLYLITIYENGEIAQKFTEAMRAEGIKSEGEYSGLCLSMQEWGLHWYFNNVSLVNRRSINSSGSPWTLTANAFAADYTYNHGTLPKTDDLAGRSAILSIPSDLSEDDVEDIVTAFHKVAANMKL